MAEPIEPDRETRREAGSAKRLERTKGTCVTLPLLHHRLQSGSCQVGQGSVQI